MALDPLKMPAVSLVTPTTTLAAPAIRTVRRVALCLDSAFISVIPGVGAGCAVPELDHGQGGPLQLVRCWQRLSRRALDELSLGVPRRLPVADGLNAEWTRSTRAGLRALESRASSGVGRLTVGGWNNPLRDNGRRGNVSPWPCLRG